MRKIVSKLLDLLCRERVELRFLKDEYAAVVKSANRAYDRIEGLAEDNLCLSQFTRSLEKDLARAQTTLDSAFDQLVKRANEIRSLRDNVNVASEEIFRALTLLGPKGRKKFFAEAAKAGRQYPDELVKSFKS